MDYVSAHWHNVCTCTHARSFLGFVFAVWISAAVRQNVSEGISRQSAGTNGSATSAASGKVD
jgi:hypothetical protein